jgi:hypothetical protein
MKFILLVAFIFGGTVAYAEMTYQAQRTVWATGATLAQAEQNYPKAWQKSFETLKLNCEKIDSYAERSPYMGPDNWYKSNGSYTVTGWFWARCWRR